MSAAPCERCHGSGEIARDDGRFRLVPTPCPECTWSELDALRAELAALKARRCDGCAHSAPKWSYYPNDGLRCARIHADVTPDFSCAAWTAITVTSEDQHEIEES